MAAAMELAELRPEWLGANIVLEGLPDLTLVPPSSRLIFEGGAALAVDMEDDPASFRPARSSASMRARARAFAAPPAAGAGSPPGWSARGEIGLGGVGAAARAADAPLSAAGRPSSSAQRCR